MFVYMACSPSRIHLNVLKENNAENLLFSYAFIKKPERLITLLGDFRPKRIILDSGAFSSWSNGGHISLEDYGHFAKEFQNLLGQGTTLSIVNLDVIPGKWGYVPNKDDIATSSEKGWENMLYLESLGLRVIHTFHQHEDFAILDKLRYHSDYIGISPANDVSMAEKLLWLNKVFLRIRGSVKTHGFAVTGHKQLFGYPFYSVDSSSWVTPARFGRIPVLTDQLEVKTFAYKNINDVEKFWSYISDMGIDKIAAPTWHDRTAIGIRTYQKLQREATEVWARRGVIFEPSVDNSVAISAI